LNCVVELQTNLTPQELFEHTMRIEGALGKNKKTQNGPRTIDIDILLYDDLVENSAEISIPHPRMHERAFVLIPLHGLAPDVVHPLHKKTIAELKKSLTDQHIVKLYRTTEAQ